MDKTLILKSRGLTVRLAGDVPIAAVATQGRAYKLRSDNPRIQAAQAVWLGRDFATATIISPKRMYALMDGE